jgi:pimeloyl-ACP methyl ester carboxylesterase
MPHRNGRPVTALLLAATMAGCTLNSAPDDVALQETSPYVLDGCVRQEDGRLLTLPDPDGAQSTQGVLLGDAPRAIIFAPDRDANVCQWLSYGQALVGRGFRVALYDHDRNSVPDQKLASVVAAVRSDGATSVVLVGAGDGANHALLAAARIKPSVGGVIALSPPRRIPGQEPVEPAMPRLRMPLLFVSAEQDPGSAATTVRRYEDAAGTDATRVVMVDGRGRGSELLAGASGAVVRTAIEGFLDTQSSAP